MENQSLFIGFILLAFTSSLTRAEKINDIIAKFNERRAAGILPQPRVGRTADMSNFAELDHVAGLIHYPRVGRSGFLTSFTSINENPIEFEKMGELSDGREIDLISLVNFEVQKHPRTDNTPEQQRFEILKKSGRWKGIELSRHEATRRDQHHPRLNYCIDRAKNGDWSLSFAPLKGFVKSERQSARNYVPPFTGEIDHAQQNIVL